MKIRKQSAQPLCFMNESQLNSQEHEHCSGTDVAFHSTHWKVYQSKLSVVLDDVNVISEACFSLMTWDPHDELAGMDHSMIVVALTPLFVKNFNSYVCYVTFFIISVLFCLVCEHETVSINYTSFCCVWVLLLYIMKRQGGNLQNMDSQFHFLFGDFHLCLCYNFLNYSPMVRLQTVRSV